MIRRMLAKKGISLCYGINLKMVENYIPSFQVNDGEAFRQRINENIETIADAIRNREHNRIQPFTFVNTLIHRVYPDRRSDRHFTVSPLCTGCSVCRKVCPAGNIGIEQKKPIFRHQCEHCLACIHGCPVHAINWKHKTEEKARFINTGVTLDELIALNKRDG